MRKPSILFKAQAVSVEKLTVVVDGNAATAEAVATLGAHRVMLDAAAAEVLTDYLRVIRAYFSYGKPKELVQFVYQKSATQLLEILEESGKKIATEEDVTLLIQQLGCLHDWAQWDLELQHHAG
ncbi:hypothetical protein [Cesiribacter sp. SM1]|uniref:hypothetical protein n=1 Tax=Cesiribacter sp. SM1 TaxID=2861196 RepID=UPI001CD1D5AD|nr:hypothetical protein [Cesiribacter sp. SM1]